MFRIDSDSLLCFRDSVVDTLSGRFQPSDDVVSSALKAGFDPHTGRIVTFAEIANCIAITGFDTRTACL